jgi:hypothetical protein
MWRGDVKQTSKGRNRPLMPVKPRRDRRTHASALRPAIREILERTARWRFEVERFVADVDLAELDGIEAVVYGPRREQKETTKVREYPSVDHKSAPIYLPKRTAPCPRGCGLAAHPETGCAEMLAWLRTAKAVRRHWAWATSP